MATGARLDIRLKRIYDDPSPEDGYRILSMRYWPRGIARSKVDEYVTKTAPSKGLLHAYLHEGLGWAPYVDAYLSEMQSDEARAEIARLAELARSRTITLMCGCEDETRCHRSVLRQLIVDAS
jgi:uncharacterized protein YeaO (DUF488 family)